MRTAKVRPAIVVSNNKYNSMSNDVVVVPLTTNLQSRDYSFVITNDDLERGRLIKDSNIKVDKIFSVDKNLIRLTIGRVRIRVHRRIKELVTGLIN
jgi:mRNA interferase MazF